MSSVAYGANIAFIEELYEKYRTDPTSVSASWREFFADYDPPALEEEEVEERVAAVAGAGVVTPIISDEQVTLARYRSANDASFDRAPSWLYEGMAKAFGNNAARLAIAGDPLPEGFELGDECELRDPADTRVLVKAQRHDLGCEEVREHLKAGKQAFRVALVFEERLSFVLGEDLVIRKLKFLDSVTEQLEQDNAADARAELDAVFALMSGELARLLGRLEMPL